VSSTAVDSGPRGAGNLDAFTWCLEIVLNIAILPYPMAVAGIAKRRAAAAPAGAQAVTSR
jgi:hypothetical protein